MRAIVRAADGAVRHRPGGLLLLSALLLVLVVSARAQTPDWTVPDDAATLTSPLSATAEVARRGDELFAARCKKCHGAEGRGDGPYSDPKHPAADLTQPEVAATPDGILFYKIWNGRRPMPAFKTDLEKNDVWALVAHVKMLGTPAPALP
jgi:mono/diheme cytochrome c family protein